MRNAKIDQLNIFINWLKKNNLASSALCIDRIPNEVSRQEDIRVILYKLFHKCIMLAIVHIVWLKAIITPISKSSPNDPYVPLNYSKHWSLLSCVGQLFSGIINGRCVNNCEENTLYEQTDFRKCRSCEDHIFGITSITKQIEYQKVEIHFVHLLTCKKPLIGLIVIFLFYKLLNTISM